MEIKKLCTREAHNAGAEMRVVGPDGKPTDFYISLAGQDSDNYQIVQRKMQLKSYTQKFIIAKDLEQDPDTAGAVMIMKLSVEGGAAITLGWRGLEDKGVPVEFTQETAKNLYQEASYIVEQIEGFVNERANFTKPLKKG